MLLFSVHVGGAYCLFGLSMDQITFLCAHRHVYRQTEGIWRCLRSCSWYYCSV